jgi:hypothetical protein
VKKVIFSFVVALLATSIVVYPALGGQTIKLSDEQSGLSLLSQDDAGLLLQIDIGALDLQSVSAVEGEFMLLSVAGFSRSHRVGEPSLPMINRLISIPLGCELKAEVVESQAVEVSLSDYGVSVPLLPVQPSISKSQDPATVPFEYIREIYAGPGYYGLPAVETSEIGMMRAVRLALVSVAPIEYDPQENMIRVTRRMTVKIDYLHPDRQATDEMRRRLYSPFYEPAYNRILNYEPPQTVILDDLVQYPVRYVIVSDRMFESQLQPFIEWKTKKGFEVVVAYTDVIGYSNTAIRSYIQNLYDSADPPDNPAPSFVLLVGDDQQIQAFSGNAGSHITDLRFCEFTGDYLPEIYYGRFSAQSTGLLQPQIDKTLEYEQYLMPDPGFLGEVTMIAGVDAYYAPTHGNGQINYGVNLYFNAGHDIYSNTWLYPESSNPGAAAAIIQTVDDGIGFINYTAHGSHDGWGNPGFSSGDVNSLTNAHMYPLAIGNCCLTSTFGDNYSTPCVGEVWLQAANKGAIGYIGASNSTYWDEDYWWGVGYGPVIGDGPTYEQTGLGAYDGVFHDHGEPVSQHYIVNDALIFCGNMAVEESGSGLADYYWEAYHLFGDPSVMTYLGVPIANNVQHDPVIFVTATSLTVSADPGSYVGLTVDGIQHGSGYIDGSGVVEIQLVPFDQPGEADIVVTAQNRVPYISTIQIVMPEGPYVVFDSYVVNDFSGNNNGLADAGESILLGVQLENVGPDDALDVTANLSSDDLYATIFDGFESYGDIPGNGGTAYVADAYSFDIDPGSPDEHALQFQLDITGTALDTWVSNFVLPVYAPQLAYIDVIIDDAGGNGNGILDPGETADLTVAIANNGSGEAGSVSGFLWESDAYVSIADPDGTFGDILPGETGDNSGDVFTASAESSCPQGYIATLNIDLETDLGYEITVPFDIIVGDRAIIFADDFSSDLGWTGLGGSGEWTIAAATGGSGSDEHGGPDPETDHSPSSDNGVLGNDLAPGTGGDYNPGLGVTYWVTSPTIDCSDYSSIIMTFYRWLGVEDDNWDNAYFQAYNGNNWVTLFENSATIDESAWSEQSFDLSAIADENPDFQIRFGIGPTDDSWQFCGWNLDDIEIKGYSGGGGPPPEEIPTLSQWGLIVLALLLLALTTAAVIRRKPRVIIREI